MKIATVETIPVSVPYRHREVSSIVARDGVSDVLVKLPDYTAYCVAPRDVWQPYAR